MMNRVKKQILSAVCAFGILCSNFSSTLHLTAEYLDTETNCSQQNFELYPNGEEAEQTVILNGIMPEGASVTAVDVTETLPSEENLILTAYDITITDGEKEYQPDENTPILVEIIDSQITETSELWHIKDNGEQEQITNFTAEDGKISFYATGFSIYAIVEPLKSSEEQTNGIRILNFNDLNQYAEEGIFIKHAVSGTYMTGESRSENGKNGISLTENLNQAVRYYFENISGNNYHIYCLNGDEKQYLKINGSNLTFDSESNASSFSFNADFNKFTCNGKKVLQKSGDILIGSGEHVFEFWYYEPSQTQKDALDGKTYGLMHYTKNSFGNAFMADTALNYLPLTDIVIRTDASADTYYISENSHATMWTFHSVPEKQYILSAIVNQDIKYLKINEDNSISFTEESEASPVKIISGNNGKIKICSGEKKLVFNNEDGFSVKTSLTDEDDVWLNFIEPSCLTQEDYMTYTAEKISISEVVNGQSVLVYTRIWNDEDKKYYFYAIDSNGNMIPCYERGNDIMWIGNQFNALLWDFTEYYWENSSVPNYYYELYNAYSEKYLAPQIENKQVLSDHAVGINMMGRKNGEYYTDILAWDDKYYSYAGLKFDIENNKIISCPKSKAETFYFAVVKKDVPPLTPIDTIDNTNYGITMKMIDYKNNDLQTEVIGDNSDGYNKNLLSTDLKENGYPTTENGQKKSLFELYKKASKVNHLFIQSTYEESGYFEFDSCQNFATLIPTKDGNFTVYKELGTNDNYARSTLKHGQFLPYNTIQAGKYATQYNTENLYSALADWKNNQIGILPDADPRKYEKLYTVGGSPNYYYGMELEANFVQTPNGCDAWGHDMIFEFTGDDDFWLYVDGELVIDLGGIHSALAGNVNFATGKVSVNDENKTLKQVFEENYKTRNPDATIEQINQYLSEYFAYDSEKGVLEDVFKDYSSHSMKIFYMERGAGAANLHMRFNLSNATPGNVRLTKNVSGTNDLDFDLVQYPYQIWYTKKGSEEEFLLSNEDELVNVTYPNSIQDVDYKETYSPPNSNQTYESVYFINPHQSVEIHFPDNTEQYRVVECGVNTEVYDYVEVNGVKVTGTEILESTNRKNFDSGLLAIDKNPNLVFNNHVDPESLRTLTVEKKLYDENGNLLSETKDSSKFNFRLYLSNGADDILHLANMYPYYVKNSDGNYCSWDAENQKFVSTGKSDLSEFITKEEKESITFETSMNGSISKIPADYKIEIPNLPVGMKFKFEERESEVPLGYQLIGYERDSGTYRIQEGDTPNSGTIRAHESPFMIVKNKRGWGLSADKVWSDKNYVTTHDAIFTAVYVNDTLLEGTVKQIQFPDTSVQYFFDTLQEGHTFQDYTIREVELENPSVNSNGIVSYSKIKRLDMGDLISLKAVSKFSQEQETFDYSVNYDDSVVTGTAENTRSSIITNTRSGGIVLTLYDMKTKEQLSNGIFTLKDGDIVLDTFKADENGRITILYDYEPNKEYVLTETVAPEGYLLLPNPVVIKVTDENVVSISGNEEIWEKVTKASSQDTWLAYIDLYNKPFTLSAMKYDKITNQPLSDAHFSLYKGFYNSIDSEIVKNYTPISGYENLITGTDGIIPKIDNTLSFGTYYLTETVPPNDYQLLSEDIIFTISTLGEVTIENEEYSDFLEKIDNLDEMIYIIRVPNESTISTAELTIKKLVSGSFGNKAKDFQFTFAIDGTNASGEYIWTKNGIPQKERIHSGDTFTMQDGDVIIITLPVNHFVTVIEDSQGYETSFKLGNANSEITNSKKFLLTEDIFLEITNTMNMVIPTGIPSAFPAVIIFVIGSAGFIVMMLRKKFIK